MLDEEILALKSTSKDSHELSFIGFFQEYFNKLSVDGHLDHGMLHFLSSGVTPISIGITISIFGSDQKAILEINLSARSSIKIDATPYNTETDLKKIKKKISAQGSCEYIRGC